jgi:hypothetical protein
MGCSNQGKGNKAGKAKSGKGAGNGARPPPRLHLRHRLLWRSLQPRQQDLRGDDLHTTAVPRPPSDAHCGGQRCGRGGRRCSSQLVGLSGARRCLCDFSAGGGRCESGAAIAASALPIAELLDQRRAEEAVERAAEGAAESTAKLDELRFADQAVRHNHPNGARMGAAAVGARPPALCWADPWGRPAAVPATAPAAPAPASRASAAYTNSTSRWRSQLPVAEPGVARPCVMRVGMPSLAACAPLSAGAPHMASSRPPVAPDGSGGFRCSPGAASRGAQRLGAEAGVGMRGVGTSR